MKSPSPKIRDSAAHFWQIKCLYVHEKEVKKIVYELMKRYKGCARFGEALKRARGPDELEYLRRTRKADRQLRMKLDKADPGSSIEKQYFRLIRKIDNPDFRARRARHYGIKTTSIRELARLVGVSKNTLLDYEAGRRYPPLEFVLDICDALKIDPNALVRQWFRYHPNDNVSIYRNLGFVNNQFENVLGEIRGHEKSNLIRFIAAAITVAHHHSSEYVFDVSKTDRIGKIAVVATYLMQGALAKGREVHPSSISVQFSEWEQAYLSASSGGLKGWPFSEEAI